jgi:hypothetical protein
LLKHNAHLRLWHQILPKEACSQIQTKSLFILEVAEGSGYLSVIVNLLRSEHLNPFFGDDIPLTVDQVASAVDQPALLIIETAIGSCDHDELSLLVNIELPHNILDREHWELLDSVGGQSLPLPPFIEGFKVIDHGVHPIMTQLMGGIFEILLFIHISGGDHLVERVLGPDGLSGFG